MSNLIAAAFGRSSRGCRSRAYAEDMFLDSPAVAGAANPLPSGYYHGKETRQIRA